jgi:hypothetical protein
MCERRSVGICCHESPHGEAVGSRLRLFHTISKNGNSPKFASTILYRKRGGRCSLSQKVSKKGRILPRLHPKFIRNSSARAFLTASRRILFLRCEKSKSVYFLQRERTGPILGRFCVHEKDVHYATDLSDATSVSEGFVRHEMSLPGE